MLADMQYIDLTQLWHECTISGPPIDKATFHSMDFVEWLDTDGSNEYGIAAVEAFFAEKDRHLGSVKKYIPI